MKCFSRPSMNPMTLNFVLIEYYSNEVVKRRIMIKIERFRFAVTLHNEIRSVTKKKPTKFFVSFYSRNKIWNVLRKFINDLLRRLAKHGSYYLSIRQIGFDRQWTKLGTNIEAVPFSWQLLVVILPPSPYFPNPTNTKNFQLQNCQSNEFVL